MTSTPPANPRKTDKESRPILFLVYDREDWESDDANVVSVCSSLHEAQSEDWPSHYAITKAYRLGEVNGVPEYGNESRCSHVR